MPPDNPFAPVHSRQSFVETPGGAEALRRLDGSLGAREPFLLITGGAGVGKTALASEAVARWGTRVTTAFIAHSTLPGPEFLEEIIRRFGAEPPEQANRSKLVACVEGALAEIASRGQVAVLVVDDAHHLSVEQFEELRLLVNAAQQARRPLEVLLIGPPALEARLDAAALAPAAPARLGARLDRSRQARPGALSIACPRPGPTGRVCSRADLPRDRGVDRWRAAAHQRAAAETLRVARAWGDQTVGQEHVQTAVAALGGFVRTGVVEDGEDAAASAATPSAPASAKAPEVAPVVTPVAAAPVAPTPVAPVAPTPVAAPVAPAVPAAHAKPAAPAKVSQPEPLSKAKVVVRAPAPSPPPAEPASSMRPAIASHFDESDRPTPPANHDPREWVARFVGDKGPVQIGRRRCRRSGPATWIHPEPSAGGSANPAEAPAKPRGARKQTRLARAHRAPKPCASRPVRSRGDCGVVAVVLLMRVSGPRGITRGRPLRTRPRSRPRR